MFTLFISALCPLYEEQFLLAPTVDLADFLGFFFVSAVFAFPIAVGVVLWKNFVTDRPSLPPEVGVLGLDDRPSLYSETTEPGVSAWTILLYFLTSLITFGLGVLLFHTVQAFS